MISPRPTVADWTGPNRCRRRTRRGKSDFWELSQITENLRVKSEKCQLVSSRALTENNFIY